MQHLRLAIRALRATPIVSIVAVLSLALGIGANTAIFSIVNSLLLRALPVKAPQQLALVTNDSASRMASWTNPIWEQIRQRGEIFDGVFAWSTMRFNLAAGGETQFVDGIWVSGGLFDTLGVPAMLGRTITVADDARGGGPDGPVAVISYAFWQRRFAGAADAIGRTLTIERVPYTIIGVTPADFFGPDVGRAFGVAIPIGTEPLIRGNESALDEKWWWWLTVMARLKPGQSVEAGTAALRGVQPQIREGSLPEGPPGAVAEYLKDKFTLVAAGTGNSQLRQRYQRPLLTILVVVGLVLLIACANIANLLLARATARRHEWSVRLALGAARWQLARQLLTESLILAASGAALGVVIARWSSRLLVQQLSTQTNTVFLDLALDWRVFAFTSAVTIGTALLFGMAPAFGASRVPPMEALKEQGPTFARGAAVGKRFALVGHLNVASALVVAQVALSLVLVVAAGLFMRTFSSLANLHLGFDRDRVLLVAVNSLRTDIPAADRLPMWERLRQRVLAVPGVSAAAVSFVTPVSGNTWNNRVDVSGAVPLSERQRISNFNAVTPGWFTTYGTPVLAGRDINDGDRKTAPPVILVNQAFAKRFLNGANPIGHTVTIGVASNPQPPKEIVGLVADAVYRALREPVPPTMYVPVAQFDDSRSPAPPQAFLSVRSSSGSPALLARSVGAAINGVNRDLALTYRLLSDQVNQSLTQERVVAMLSGFFGALALLLAGLGLYGVTSYAVTRRRGEIGIRLALGAAPSGVVRLVLSRVSVLVIVGVVVGAGASVWLSRFVETLLFGLEPRDPATLAAAAATLVTVGAVAGWLPAHRASRIDPAQVLRDS